MEIRSSDDLAKISKLRWDSDNTMRGEGLNKNTNWEKNSRKALWPRRGRG
jgi:hypothetical protein